MSVENISLKVPKPNTKQAKAIEIVKRLGLEAKKQGIQTIMTELEMSQYGSTTYWHNARRFLAAQAVYNIVSDQPTGAN
jgi:hypothetical protein